MFQQKSSSSLETHLTFDAGCQAKVDWRAGWVGEGRSCLIGKGGIKRLTLCLGCAAGAARLELAILALEDGLIGPAMADVAVPLHDGGIGLDLAEVVTACGDGHGEVEGGF
jgi:hypothetical protein